MEDAMLPQATFLRRVFVAAAQTCAVAASAEDITVAGNAAGEVIEAGSSLNKIGDA